jgi:hypothetical protein
MNSTLSRRSFIAFFVIAPVGLVAPVTAAPNLGPVLRTLLPGWEAFQKANFKKVLSEAELELVKKKLQQEIPTAASLRRVWGEDYKRGELCELRGVIMARSECATYALAVQG